MSTLEFNNLVMQYTNPLKSFAINLTKDMEDANDLLQETRFRALSNKDKYKDGTNIKAWLFTIMKNIFINNYRKRVKRNTIFDSTSNMYYINSSDTLIHNGGEANCVMEDIEHAISNLNDDYRVPFMKFFNGFKYQEIADELNLPLGTVKSRIFFARKELKDKLNIYHKN